MSWSDDTRCLYCDGKLPLYRKITSGQFCSAGHRKAYWQEQERLAVERLHQTHDSLRAYRPPEALEPPRREVVAPPPVAATAPLPSRSFVEYQDGPTVEDRARSASNTGQVRFAGFLVEPKPEPKAMAATEILCDVIGWSLDESTHGWSSPPLNAGLMAGSWEYTPAPVVRFFDALAFAAGRDVPTLLEGSPRLLPSPSAPGANAGMRLAAHPDTPEFVPGFVGDLLALEAAVVESAVTEPELVIEAKPVIEVAEEPVAVALDPVIGTWGSMLPLPRMAARSCEFPAKAAPQEVVKIADATSVRYARISAADSHCAAPEMANGAVLLPLTVVNAPRQQEAQLRGADPEAVALNPAPGAPRTAIDLPTIAPALRFAAGSRYSMSVSAAGGVPPAESTTIRNAPDASSLLDLKTNRVEMVGSEMQTGLGLAPGCKYAVSFQPAGIEQAPIRQNQAQPVPAKPEILIAGLPSAVGTADLAPVFPRMRPLAFQATAKSAPPIDLLTDAVVHTYPANQPMQPVAKWQPIEGELQPPPKTGFLSSWSQAMSQVGQGTDGEKKYVWSHVADFWQHAPRDLKLLSIAIPVLLGLALRPSLPKVRVTAPATPSVVSMQGSSFERGLHERLMVVRETVAERAGVELNEDFRSGLDDWQTRGDLSTAWSFDPNGFVKPGALALYRPSIGLKDYEMEFLGLIDKKALSWVVRASDFDNYYVVKLVVLKPGPMPTLGITRYAVIHGKAQDRVDTVAAINARTDTLYRVNLNVRDDTYLLTLQGQVVDNWTEPRLTSGGIGFFSQQGEESRLRWVQVSHQYDMLGRLCAYLAPYNIQN